jgi:hypothetical protein
MYLTKMSNDKIFLSFYIQSLRPLVAPNTRYRRQMRRLSKIYVHKDAQNCLRFSLFISENEYIFIF